MLGRFMDPTDKFLLDWDHADVIDTKWRLMLKSIALRRYILFPFVVVILAVAMYLTLPETIAMTRVFFLGSSVTADHYAVHDGSSSLYNLEYSFSVPGAADTQSLSHTQQVGNDIAVKVEFQHSIAIRYLPDDPTQNYYIDSPNLIYVRAGGSLLCLLLIPLLTFLTIRFYGDYYRLVKKSRQTPGKLFIGRLQQITGNKQGSNFVVVMDYSVRPWFRKLEGQTTAIRNDLRPETLPAAGTKVYVLVRSNHDHRAL